MIEEIRVPVAEEAGWDSVISGIQVQAEPLGELCRTAECDQAALYSWGGVLEQMGSGVTARRMSVAGASESN
jgi:hypothetical protein